MLTADVVMAADGVPGVAAVLAGALTVSRVAPGVSGKGVRLVGGEVAPGGGLDVISEPV